MAATILKETIGGSRVVSLNAILFWKASDLAGAICKVIDKLIPRLYRVLNVIILSGVG